MRAVERHSYRAGNAAVRASMTNFLRHVGALISLGLGLVLACAANAAAQQTIWPSTSVPAAVDSGSSGPVELGVSLKADTSGTVTAIRFYKSAANTGLHVGHLWSRTGALLATVTFTGETSSGWQQANFSTPVAITANTVYVASYETPIGHWSVNWNYFATSGVNNPPLHALQNGAGNPDGVYASLGAFPKYTYLSANFWVDVVFNSAAAVAPSITTQPVSQTVTAGQTATFSVTASGTAPLNYQWRKNGAVVSSGPSASYTTPATIATDTGAQFTVLASNSAGSMTSNAATLTVNAAPVAPSITTQPASQTVTAGQTATFSVTASGTAPLNYQWLKNGAAVSSGPSASYTTPATIATDTGAQFTVSVSNSAGSITSSAATLTVNADTQLLSANPTSLSFGNINTGASSTLPVTLTNSGNSNVTISKVGISGAGFNPSGVPAGTILRPGQTATLNVTFAPAATGSVVGNVTVTSDAQNSPTTISLSGVGVTPSSSAFTSWVAPGLVRVGPSDAPGTASSISLSGARGETVDTQVIVRGPAGGLTNLNLTASPLTGPSGATIAASNVVLYREYYVTVNGTVPQGGFPSAGTNPPLGSGTYAEPLIPFVDPETGAALNGSLKAVPATVAANQNQPFWVDISIPRGALNSPPGTYTGTISVTSTQGNVTVPITVTVWNFELPMKPSELSEWTLWNPNTGNTVASLAQALMRNKVMSRYDNASAAASDMATLGMNRVGLDGSFYIGMQCNGGFSSLPTQVQIAAAAATFPTVLALDEYVADELTGCSGAYSKLKTLARNLHASGVKSIATFNAVDPNLQDDGNGILPAIDHWVLLTAVQQWPALPYTGKGDLWSYTSCNIGFGNTPEWLIDYPPINERIQAGFLDWMEGAAGVLYYRADGWTSGNAIGSWDNLNISACGSGSSNPGDGIFLYPPGPVGSTEPAPGIRLKAIRDGIQDYEYVQILQNLGQGAFATSVIQPIAASWTNWTHDPNALEGARLQLGQKLNQLAP